MQQLITNIELKYKELQIAISETGSLSSADRIFFILPTSIRQVWTMSENKVSWDLPEVEMGNRESICI